MKVIVQDRQCLADIALQVCGSIEAIFAIAEKNNLAITDDLIVGQILDYDLSDVQDKQVVMQYKVDNVIPAGAVKLALEDNLTIPKKEDFGLTDIREFSDIATRSAVLKNVFTKQFNIQFA